MLRHAYGGAVIFIFLQDFILPCLTDCRACKPDEGGIAIRAVSQAGKIPSLRRERRRVSINMTKFWLEHD